MPLERSGTVLTCEVNLGTTAVQAGKTFDYESDEHPGFIPWTIPDGLPESWGVGVIVGGSGSGKSTLLRSFGSVGKPDWRSDLSIADHFETEAEAVEKFYAVGLSSVPTWMKPYHVLSNGEAFRADLARTIGDGALIDEFTSVVDRNVAAAASQSLGKWVRETKTSRMVLATVHRDVLTHLQPDWIIDTDTGMWANKPRECLQRSPMVADIYEVDRTMWKHFMGHHYLTPNLHPFARCYIAVVSGSVVSFAAAIPFPHGRIKNAWRETRLVTLPDYQGLGIGPRLSDWVAEAHARSGYSFYGKTTHPRLGEYRERNPKWVSTSHNKRGKQPSRNAPTSFANRTVNAWVGSSRPSYSHKFNL